MTELFKAPAAQLERDRWGRPLIIPIDGGTPKPYARVTTLAGVMEDTYNISLWQARMAAEGVAIRPDIHAAVLATRAAMKADPLDTSSKKEMKELVKEAQVAAGGDSAARAGTALHSFTERVDLGEEVGYVPDEYARDISAYSEIMEKYGIKVLSVEQFVVNDLLEVGGTPDRILDVGDLVAPDGTKPGIVIGDLKSGKEVIAWGSQKISIQLGIYAHSKVYEPDGSRKDLPGDPSTKWAIVIHLPIGTGEASLLWFDIEAGYEAAFLAKKVLAWQARKDLVFPVETVVAAEVEDKIATGIAEAKTVEALVALYKKNTMAWKPEHTKAAKIKKASLTNPAS